MILLADKLTKGFRSPGGARLKILDDLRFGVEKGETVAVMGQSGSGKSTLLSLLGGLDYPDSGNVSIDGANISSMNENSLAGFRAKHVGFVFQQFFLMPHLTAAENVALPLEIAGAPDAVRLSEEALDQTGLGDRKHHFPNQLSGGESQRVAIARALVARPSLLLADEPTGNLDVGIGNLVTDLLFDLVGKLGMTMVMVTHNPELAERCDRTLKLIQGRFE